VSSPPERLRAALADRYAIERELGRGGMATVYLARDLRHDRPVALKVLHPDLSHALGPERFQREIRMAARLQHPHILTVHDSGEIPGEAGAPPILWFTMPFVEGESLRDRLRRERQLPVEDALRITREAAQALQYAHEHDVVHRDVKPENLLLTRDGNTLVADFGIARALGSAQADGRETALTQTGMSIGTPAYMSPEQASGERGIDARTDVYALGCVLFEMLAGEPPFTGATAQQIIVKRFTDPVPSVRRVRPAVPTTIDEAIQKALAPIPADRFAGTAQFAAALQAAATPVFTPVVTPTAIAPSVAHPAPTPTATRSRRRVPVAALALGLGFLIGLGVLFAWRQNHGEAIADAAGVKRVAVLPFQNLGDTADVYFAEGITDAVRGKLTSLPGMFVTASNSSNQYRGTTKSPQEIGRELGVDYLLIGKVRWAKAKEGASRVQVSPELIEVRTARATWQQPFDAALTDVFKVQGDIAGQVAAALDVALGASQQRALAERPTTNLTAYDVYLKGAAARARSSDPATLRAAVGHFERAVALDSTFAVAWAALSEAASLLYGPALSPQLAEQSRSAAERAIALNPRLPEGYRALGDYYRRVVGDGARATAEYRRGLEIAPSNADLLRVLAYAEQNRGQWEASLEHLTRSQRLDPRSVLTAQGLANTLVTLRRYSEALAAADRALALEPADLSTIENKAMAYLGQGNLAEARAVLAEPPAGVDLPTFVAYMATFQDLYWALNEQQQALLRRLSPGPFDNDMSFWGLALAGAWEVKGDMKRARAYADSARIALEQQLRVNAGEPQRTSLLGVALAYLGRRDDAIRLGEQAMKALPLTKDAVLGSYLQHQMARSYILLGEPDKALDLLEPLLRIPYYLSPGWLRLDPTFDPIRKHPRFQRLVEGAATS
jgi:TolB-like protein/tetratricopeptide (TPR) repeat protein/tRNA A-37 threonylcarbamoyl transferase component Bud32